MAMVMHVHGASLEERERGMRAAQEILDAAGVTDVEGAWALADLECWYQADKAERSRMRKPTEAMYRAAIRAYVLSRFGETVAERWRGSWTTDGAHA